jgi:hypothetical protein
MDLNKFYRYQKNARNFQERHQRDLLTIQQRTDEMTTSKNNSPPDQGEEQIKSLLVNQSLLFFILF